MSMLFLRDRVRRGLTYGLVLPLFLSACGTAPPSPIGGVEPSTESVSETESVDSESASAPLNADLSGSEIVTAKVGLSAQQQADGVLALFDGESLFGWQTDKIKGDWKVEDGAIVCKSGDADLLLTAVPFADFELTLDFQIDEGGNSGVFVRTADEIKSVAEDTYEVNIAAEHPKNFTTGSIVERLEATGVAAGDDGDWHSMRIVCDGPRIQTFVDGDDAADLLQTDDSPGQRKSGYIGLQHRIGGVAFRRIYLKPLNLTPQFTTDLSGWHVTQAKTKDGSMGEAEFAWTEAGVTGKSGLGFLESNATYKNMIVQFTATTNANDVNSGLFFRMEKGTPEAPSNGYELQIHNGFDGDRSKAADGGPGGIFRRQSARLVTTDDMQPATSTLVAYGDRFMTWANGYPVVDWTDDRPADPNPRRGLRLESGHLSIQAHDSTTDVTINKFAVAEIPAVDNASD